MLGGWSPLDRLYVVMQSREVVLPPGQRQALILEIFEISLCLLVFLKRLVSDRLTLLRQFVAEVLEDMELSEEKALSLAKFKNLTSTSPISCSTAAP